MESSCRGVLWLLLLVVVVDTGLLMAPTVETHRISNHHSPLQANTTTFISPAVTTTYLTSPTVITSPAPTDAITITLPPDDACEGALSK